LSRTDHLKSCVIFRSTCLNIGLDVVGHFVLGSDNGNDLDVELVLNRTVTLIYRVIDRVAVFFFGNEVIVVGHHGVAAFGGFAYNIGVDLEFVTVVVCAFRNFKRNFGFGRFSTFGNCSIAGSGGVSSARSGIRTAACYECGKHQS